MTMITPSYLGETIEYSSLHACRSTLEDPTSLREIFWHEISWSAVLADSGKTPPNLAAWIFSRSSLFQTEVSSWPFLRAANWPHAKKWTLVISSKGPEGIS